MTTNEGANNEGAAAGGKKREKMNWFQTKGEGEESFFLAQRSDGTWSFKLEDGRRKDGFEKEVDAYNAAVKRALTPYTPRPRSETSDEGGEGEETDVRLIDVSALTEDQLEERIVLNAKDRVALKAEYEKRVEIQKQKLAAIKAALEQ